MLNDPGQAGDGASVHSKTALCCGGERGTNDRGVYVPNGLTREEIVLVGKELEEEFYIPMYIGRHVALEILIKLKNLNDAQQRDRTP